MKRRGLSLVVVALLLAASATGAAAQELFAPKKNPYDNLFAPRIQEPRARPLPPTTGRATTPAPAPKVVCGMVMVPADPAVDSKILVRPPDNGVRYSVRAVTPTICKPE